MCFANSPKVVIFRQSKLTYSSELGNDLVCSLKCGGLVLLLLKLVLHHSPHRVLVLESEVSGWDRLALAVFRAVVLLDMGLVVSA